jgi:hypothetical protein
MGVNLIWRRCNRVLVKVLCCSLAVWNRCTRKHCGACIKTLEKVDFMDILVGVTSYFIQLKGVLFCGFCARSTY